ncbi:hypothetical protein [Streptomyces sp. BBFR109]|uniref:hypothetical protein n=1 Tax=Streptomyces sp. BBFR109 TaxID=3448172 RepID=UPI003F75B071
MTAATATEWLTAAGLATAAFIPGALLILSLDHDLRPRLPHIDLEPARETAARAAQWARLQTAALLLLLAWHLEQPKGVTR